MFEDIHINRTNTYAVQHSSSERCEVGCGICKLDPGYVDTPKLAQAWIDAHLASPEHYDAVTQKLLGGLYESTVALKRHLQKPRPG